MQVLMEIRETQCSNGTSARYWSILEKILRNISCDRSSSSSRLGRWFRTILMTVGYNRSTSSFAAASSDCLVLAMSCERSWLSMIWHALKDVVHIERLPRIMLSAERGRASDLRGVGVFMSGWEQRRPGKTASLDRR